MKLVLSRHLLALFTLSLVAGIVVVALALSMPDTTAAAAVFITFIVGMAFTFGVQHLP